MPRRRGSSSRNTIRSPLLGDTTEMMAPPHYDNIRVELPHLFWVQAVKIFTFSCSFRANDSNKPFERVAADITELPLTTNGNRYVLVVTDYFTKYINMYALPDQTAETVAQCLFDKYFCEHGISEVLHTDQGKQFESKLVHRLCKLMGIVKTRTSPYHPQSDGQVERFNRTLKSELSKRLFSTGNQWDKMLNHIAFSYNTSVHSSIGYSPFFLVNGREARMPLEVMFGDTPVGYSCHSSYGDFVDDITKRMKEASKIVGQELVKAQEKQADYVELKTRFLPYVVGDLVWVNDPAKQRDKLAARWKGPHRVIRVMNNGVTYQLQDLSKSSIPSKVIHYNRLKPYVSPYSLEDVNEKLIQPNPPSVVQGNYLPNLSLDEFYRNLPFHFESNLDTSGISPELQGGKRLDNKRLTRLGREKNWSNNLLQVKQHQHHSNSRQHTKKGTIQDGTKPSEDRIGVEDVPGGPQPSMGSTNELQRTLSNEEGKLGDLGTGKLGERKIPDQASLFGESSTSNRSRLCKTLPDFLHDNSALPYLIQFMDSFNAVQVLQCWLATESFNKASWSHSLTTTMEIEGKTNIPNDGVVGQEEGRDITTQKGNSETKTVPKIQLNGSSLNDKESVLNNNQSRQRINPMDSPINQTKAKLILEPGRTRPP
ncbi:hypothetical protein BSL78_11447 [Apostichopus japonicus]|uniref:Integrase catalytic domain-containing protein n=1 Tax=Stichopus japonicus TaxID=307972 RepID=A0A2G8KUG0_STIJA|nr:hypothetical protein BSL78_11447 [Apostichopus japonicus]